MTAPILQVSNLVRRFGALRAVDGVSFAVASGSITGLIGPNGAGKTTLFGMIAGGIQPQGGEIRFGGRLITGHTPDRIFRAGLARTFQIPRPFPRMTVLENVMLAPVRQTGERFWNNWIRAGAVRTRGARRARAGDGGAGLHRPGGPREPTRRAISGGQQKLLELARVLMIEPRLILLDEPAAGVNPTLLETLIETIAALHRRGISFLIVEHNMDVVMQLCRPIVVMAQGRVIFEGEPDGVRADPGVLDAYLGDVAA